MKAISRSVQSALSDVRRRHAVTMETMESRRMFAITASFVSSSGVLNVLGDALSNSITVSRNATGNILVNGGAIAIIGGTPTIANTAMISIFGLGSGDTIALDETNGALPSAEVFGGEGNDTVTGGSGSDSLFGQGGDDVLLGRGGVDLLSGGTENDILTGGDSDDQVFGEEGNDRMIWNPGDDTDLNEGGDGVDTVEVNGGNGVEQFTVTANGTRVRFDRLNPAPFSIDIGTTENLILNANGGDDSFSATGNLAALISITADGGAGNDTLLGSNGTDLLIGGDNNDFIDGQLGNDVVFMGAGDDVFQWDPGDGNDIVEGQAGTDRMLFNGSAGNEIFTASPNGGRVLFTRNLGSIVMDLDDVEQINLFAGAGVDAVNVNDMTGSDLQTLQISLASVLGGSTADAAVDNVVINGTNGDDVILPALQSSQMVVSGLATTVIVEHFEALDAVRLQGLGGDDIIDGTAIGVAGPGVVYDGGAGDDVLFAGAGVETLLGGDNDDILFGNGSLDGGTGENITILNNALGVTIGLVTLMGDGTDNTMTVSRNAAGAILFNGVAVPGATVANTALIRVFGGSGNDTITIDQTNGALPAAFIYGGAGQDTLTGGSGNDLVYGGGGGDELDGKGGFDFLFGQGDNDTLTGGDADDQVFGQAGNDRMIWNPGDDTDLNEGGSGVDTSQVNGGNGAEVFTATANGTRVRFDRLDPAPFSLDLGTTENLILNANGGDDSFSATGNLAALISITADGGAGNDTLLGSNGIDLLIGGDNNDFIDGQQGNDVVFMGAGDDVIQWDPGDGSDVVEGQAGTDRMLFNGSAGNEIFTASPNGGRVTFTRNLGSIVMDLDDVETIDLNMLGGIDTATINDLAGTDLTEINVDHAGTIGGSAGDAAADVVIVNGTNGDDIIDVLGVGTAAAVLGLSARINITNAEGVNDSLTINALGGNDGVTATTLPAGVVKLTVDGGSENDSLLGSQGADLFLGGAGNDLIFGDNGNDVAFMGAGNDVFQWDPGDGNDIIEGQNDLDTLLFNGSATAENIDILANGGRILFLRNVGSVTMDMDDVEAITFNALGGADNINVGDLSGTDAATINLNLSGLAGGSTGDLAPDSITVTGTNADDVISVSGSSGPITIGGLQAGVVINNAESAQDRLTVNALGGLDTVDAGSLVAGKIATAFNGGLGNDVLIGSQGDDLINGGDGNDLALMGAGNDTFVWNPGDDNDVLEGQSGADTMLFNGAGVAENITISPNGGRTIFFRDIASVTMDTNDLETIQFNAFGGADNITIQSLTGTDVTHVNLELGAVVGGAGDAQIDTINILGGSGVDAMNVSADTASGLTVTGTGPTINVKTIEPANDRLNFIPLGGADVVSFNSIIGIDGTQMKVDLATTAGGAIADGVGDSVTVGFTSAANTIGVTDGVGSTVVTGATVAITVSTADSSDSLRLNALGGNDGIVINQSGAAGGVRRVLVDGGTELDTITVTNTAGDGAAVILPSTGNDNIGVNTDTLFLANAIFQGTQRIGALTIGAGGKATVAANGSTVLTASSLGITSTGRLDVTDNAVIIDYPVVSPIASIQALITSGFNSGAWNGPGINSSTAAATPNRAVGFAQATDIFGAFPATFAGQSIDATSVLIRFTLPGDATLDRAVNISDFSVVAANFNVPGTRWSQGNFNFNSATEIGDFSALAANFNQSLPGDLPRGGTSFGASPITQVNREEAGAIVG